MSSSIHATVRILVDLAHDGRGDEIPRYLARNGFSCVRARSEANGLGAEADVVITDSLELVTRHCASPSAPAVVMLGPVQSETAVLGAARAGAVDFVVYPGDGAYLRESIEGVATRVVTIRALDALPEEAAALDGAKLVGRSTSMQMLSAQVRRLASADATVLLNGESGTGKGHVARLLHSHGERSQGPFIAINCAAIPEQLLEAELFGHERGAFTGANERKRGLFEASDGGVLFLDEIDALPRHLQAKLLRALEQRVVRAVGSMEERPFDARLICATNTDLTAALREGRIREDLYFRIKVLRIDLPPLRERGLDVLLLAQLFLQRAAAASGKGVEGFTPAAAEALLKHSWPGNVRELQNVVVRAVAQAGYSRIGVGDLELSAADVEGELDPGTVFVPLEVVEMAHVARVMKLTGGNLSKASSILGIGRKSLRSRLEKHDLLGFGKQELTDKITRSRR